MFPLETRNSNRRDAVDDAMSSSSGEHVASYTRHSFIEKMGITLRSVQTVHSGLIVPQSAANIRSISLIVQRHGVLRISGHRRLWHHW